MMRKSILVNAALFQCLWFAAVVGSAYQLMWPCLLFCGLLFAWQLHPSRRHPNDIKILAAAIVLGLIVDTLWIQIGFLKFTDPRLIDGVSPVWIMVLWAGFALTINHSLYWLEKHPILPILSGGIGGPLSYLAGLRFGAVEYLADTTLVSVCLAIGWALSITILVQIAKSSPKQPQPI